MAATPGGSRGSNQHPRARTYVPVTPQRDHVKLLQVAEALREACEHVPAGEQPPQVEEVADLVRQPGQPVVVDVEDLELGQLPKRSRERCQPVVVHVEVGQARQNVAKVGLTEVVVVGGGGGGRKRKRKRAWVSAS